MPQWTDPGLKSAISVRELISTLKQNKTKKALAENEWSNIPPEYLQARKKPSSVHKLSDRIETCLYFSCNKQMNTRIKMKTEEEEGKAKNKNKDSDIGPYIVFFQTGRLIV